MSSSDTKFISLGERYYAILNIYQDKGYVHLHNRFKKNKRFTMPFEDAMIMMKKSFAFKSAFEKLSCPDEEDEADMEPSLKAATSAREKNSNTGEQEDEEIYVNESEEEEVQTPKKKKLKRKF